MYLKYFYDGDLAQASYLLGCPGSGDAIVIDPARDVQPYIDAAAREGLRITAVTETHIHADFVSGVRELAHQTGATIYLSGEGRDFMEGILAYDFPAEDAVKWVKDDDVIAIGAVTLRVMASPGHTPEHIMFIVTDTGADKPIGIFTGDVLFVGSVGRPDLLEEAAKIADTRILGARQQYGNVLKLKTLPDYLQVWPGHGAGSACGKGLGAIPSTTLGYEKLFNPGFQFKEEDAFVKWLLADQPETPRYFGQMKRVNQHGAALLHTLETPLHLHTESLWRILTQTDDLVIDSRPVGVFADKHVKGTVNVPGDYKQFSTWAGWMVDYEDDTYLIADEAQVPALLKRLRAVGVDDIPGYFTLEVIDGHTETVEQIPPEDVLQKQQAGDAIIVDVRWQSERDADYIPGSIFMHMGEAANRADELPEDKPIIVQCGGGVRSMVVASQLQRQGYTVSNLKGGIDAWKQAGLPIMHEE